MRCLVAETIAVESQDRVVTAETTNTSRDDQASGAIVHGEGRFAGSYRSAPWFVSTDDCEMNPQPEVARALSRLEVGVPLALPVRR